MRTSPSSQGFNSAPNRQELKILLKGKLFCAFSEARCLVLVSAHRAQVALSLTGQTVSKETDSPEMIPICQA